MILFEKKNKYGSFNDLMDVSIETGDKWLDKKLNANICYGKGGGGSQQQDVPKTLRPYVTQVLDRAKGLYGSYAPQQLYQGERIMGFTPAEQAAQAGVAGMVERGISGDPVLTSAGTYYQPALGLLGAGAQQQQAASRLLGAIAPTLGASGAQFGRAERTLGGVAPALQQYQQRVGGAEQTLAGVSPELQAYRQRLGGAEAMLGATAPTLSQYEQQLQQAAQTYGGAQQQLGRAEEAARAGTGSVGIGELDTARYMSPYQQQVIDIEKRQAMQDAAQVAQAIGAKAAGMGAFGGSRQAILEGQAASDLGTRLADIQTRGSQAAYDRALQTAAQQQQLQYGEDVAALGRQSTLGQALAGLAGAQTGIGQQQAGLGISGYGGLAGAGRETAAQLAGLGGQYGNIGQQVGALAGQQAQLGGLYGDIGQQLGSLAGQQVGVGQAVGQLAGQYGAGAGAMGQQASGLAGLSQAFGNLGQQALGQGYREQGYLAGVGEQERGLQQQRADLAYQQFVEQRDYPDVQLQKFSSLIQGFPFQFSQAPQQPSGFQQAVGTAATLGGLGRGLGFFNKGGKINSGLSGVIYKQAGGTLSSLIAAYDKETDTDKKKKLFDEIAAQTNLADNRRQRKPQRPAAALKEKYLPYSESDSRLLDLAKATGRSAIELLGIPSTLAYLGANDINRLITPKNILALENQKLTDDGFTTAENLEQLYQSSDEATRKQIMATNPEDVAAELKKEGKEIKPIPAVKTEAAPIGANVVKTAEDVTGLQALLDKAFAFDKAAEEKAIKQQQGFDVAALGVQLMSTPLNQIDPALIRNLGVTNKELAGLDEKEAKQLLQKKLTELEIKKAEKELGSVDLVPLFAGIDAYVENLAQTKQLGQLAGADRNKLIAAAQEAASARAIFGGYDPDSAMAEKYLREELDKQADAFKSLVRKPKVGDDGLPLKAGNISGLLQAGLK